MQLHQDNNSHDDNAPTRAYGWLPEIIGAVLAAALLALLFIFAAGI